MFGLSELKQTRFYQEVFAEGKQEGKLETIPQLLALGLSIEQIAQALGLDEQVVRQAAQPKSYALSTFSYHCYGFYSPIKIISSRCVR